jgi:hypothetical protein
MEKLGKEKMKLISVVRFEWMGLSAAVYHVFEDDDTEIGWQVVNTSTKRVLQCISFEHARHVLDGCIDEIRRNVGYGA